MGELMDVINAKGKKKPSNKEVLRSWLAGKDDEKSEPKKAEKAEKKKDNK